MRRSRGARAAAGRARAGLAMAESRTPGLNERVVIDKPPPPPAWFTLLAAAVPALPFWLFLPLSTLIVWLPVWVAAFYLQRLSTGSSIIDRIQMPLFGSLYVSYRGLISEGWVGWKLYVAMWPVGFLMNLVESALWDTFEPFLIGQEGFGQGTAKLKPLSSKAASSASDPPAQRVTAASSILAGDPARAAAAAAFTQDELDALAEQNIKPWDPEARAALKVLFPGHD